MSFIWLIVIGAAAGFLATRLMGVQLGVPQTIAVGVLGAIIGGVTLRVLITAMGAAAGFIGALIGAIALLWAYKTFIQGR